MNIANLACGFGRVASDIFFNRSTMYPACWAFRRGVVATLLSPSGPWQLWQLLSTSDCPAAAGTLVCPMADDAMKQETIAQVRNLTRLARSSLSPDRSAGANVRSPIFCQNASMTLKSLLHEQLARPRIALPTQKPLADLPTAIQTVCAGGKSLDQGPISRGRY